MEANDSAPGDLDLVQRFVNTADLDQGTDELADQAGLAAWLDRVGMAAQVDAAGRDRVVAFREAIRALLLANHGAPPDPGAIATLDRAAAITVAFDAGGTARLEPARAGVDGVLARLLAI